MTDTPLLSAQSLTRIYRGPGGDVIACRSVDLQVSTGDFIFLRGRSGAGKTTLLNLLGADLVAEHNIAAIVSTHHPTMTEHPTRQWEIHDGTLTELPSNDQQRPPTSPAPAELDRLQAP